MLPLFLLAFACAPKPHVMSAVPEAPAAEMPAAEMPAAEAPAAEGAPAAESAAEPTISPPVTLDQFRAAFPVGTTVRLRIEMPGKAPVVQRWEWTEADAEGCTIAAQVYDADGKLLADEGAGRSSWTELMGHALFPASRTVMTESSVEVPAGRYDTWLFTVNGTDEAGVPEVKRMHFAKTMPGPPLLMTIEHAGTEVFRMTMIERSPMPKGP